MQRLATIDLPTVLRMGPARSCRSFRSSQPHPATGVGEARRRRALDHRAARCLTRPRRAVRAFANSTRAGQQNSREWRIEIQGDAKPNYAQSREHYARLIATDAPINTFGMLVLVETDQDDALIHVVEGFHRAAARDLHCNRVVRPDYVDLTCILTATGSQRRQLYPITLNRRPCCFISRARAPGAVRHRS